MSSRIINAVLIFLLTFVITNKANAGLIVGDLYSDDNGIQWIYVGSFDLADGPDRFLTNDIMPYNGIDAAKLNFGALLDDEFYALSSNDVSDYANIADFIVNHNAWYDAFDEATGIHEAGESVLANNDGTVAYDAIGDISAFIWDRARPGENMNHVFKSISSSVAVPEPSTLAIFSLALMGLLARRLQK
ncbi:MAG: PEP-CTERM sorting domain-containing protein [Cognaticolwellia sp.]